MTVLDNIIFADPANSDWIGYLDGDVMSPRLAVAALLKTVQEHSDLFSEGGYILDANDSVRSSVSHDRWQTDDVIHVMSEALSNEVSKILPGLDRLNSDTDIATLLSIYGKVCDKLSTAKRMHPVTDDAIAPYDWEKARKYARADAKPSRPSRGLQTEILTFGNLANRIANFVAHATTAQKTDKPAPSTWSTSASSNRSPTLDDVLDATLETVTSYCQLLENGEMTIHPDDTIRIMDIASKLNTSLVFQGKSLVEIMNTDDDLSQTEIHAVMTRFEKAANSCPPTPEGPSRSKVHLMIDNTKGPSIS